MSEDSIKIHKKICEIFKTMPPLDRKYYESKVKNFDEANATGEVDSQLMEYLFVASIEIAKAMSDIENTPLREAILETFKYFVEANRSVKKGFLYLVPKE